MAESDIPRDRVLRRMAALKNDRSSFDAHWRDLGQYMLPRRGRWFESDRGQQGRKKHQKVINPRALRASGILASGMMSGLTSPARPWFRLTVADPELADFWRVRNWLDAVAQLMRDILARSNFYNTLPLMYRELGVFATAPVAMLEDARDVVRFYNFTVGSYYLGQDDRLMVDTFARDWTWTVSQVVGRYGLENCSKRVRDAYSTGKVDQPVRCVQLIDPNRSRVPDKADRTGMPFRSVVIEEGAEKGEKALEDKGFNEFPILASRWETMDDTAYGTACPGMDALGDVRSLQFHEVKSAEILDKVNTPPLQAPGALQRQAVSLLPGQVTYRPPTQGQDAKVEPIYTPEPRALDYTEKKIQRIESAIDSAFFADLFLMLSNMAGVQPRNQLELMERKEEKMLVLGPVLEQLNTDTFDPAIDRLFNIMLRRNMLPPIPPELSGWPLKVEYTSVLAQAQKAIATGNMERFAAFVGQLATVDAQVVDKLNGDQMADDYADALGIPARQVNSDEQVAEMREAKAKQQQAAAMAAAAPALKQGVDAIAKAATTVPEDGSLASGMQGIQGAMAQAMGG